MKKLFYIFLFLAFAKFCKAQDTSIYFNKTLPKNAVTGTIGGEVGFFGVGYERCFYLNKLMRILFSVKLGPSPKSGIVVIPTGVLMEVFPGKNKLIAGVYLGNNIHPFAGRYSMKDVREIENNPEPLKTAAPFLYMPYMASSLGCKRYFNKKHAFSIYGNFGVYPVFELYNQTPYEIKARLVIRPIIWGGITYHRQF